MTEARQRLHLLRQPRRPHVKPPPQPAERKTWLRENRLELELGIAIAECLFVALEEDFSRVTVIVIAIPVVLFGCSPDARSTRSWVGRSRGLPPCRRRWPWWRRSIAILVPAIALVLAGILAAAAVYLLYHERPDQLTPPRACAPAK